MPRISFIERSLPQMERRGKEQEMRRSGGDGCRRGKKGSLCYCAAVV
jgi:hypothetical protein